MFARVSHDEAKAVMFPKPTDAYYTTPKDVRRALDHFNIAYSPRSRRVRSWDEIPTTSLVTVRLPNGALHWVIFQRRRDGEWDVIDPDSPNTGTLRLNHDQLSDFEGVSYFEVHARVPSAS
jgi:hypothetical protein